MTVFCKGLWVTIKSRRVLKGNYLSFLDISVTGMMLSRDVVQ